MRHIEYRKEAHVATITMNRPEKLNALTPEMTKLLQEAAREANTDEDVRVVLLNGAGSKAFSVGSDINVLDQYESNWAFRNRLEYCDIIRSIRKPVIAMVQGYALGGGLELALCADIRIASQAATFGAVEVKLGWIGGGGITQLLTRLIGYGQAMHMILSGEMISAARALELGLIEQLVRDDELEAVATAYARKIAEYSPIALQTAKSGCQMAYEVPLEAGIQYERDLQTICFYTDDSKEGVAAFKEKRQPNFKGR